MKIGDLVKDKVINQLARVAGFGRDEDAGEDYIVIELCDGSSVLATVDELELICSVEI